MAGEDGGALRMQWISATPQDGPSWSAPLEGGGEATESPTPLFAARWFKPLPDVHVPLLDGGKFSLRGDGLGDVLLLDFWATWCQPCHEELPHMQALYEAERERGLQVLAVNVEETASVVRPFVDELGLTMPIGIYDGAVRSEFLFSKLPLVIVVDRWGRMRGRWDGYVKGNELQIGEVARMFLAEQSPSEVEVATVLKGNDLLRIAWLRDTPGAIGGITTVKNDAGASEILASVGRSLTIYEADGQTGRIWDTPFVPGHLRTAVGGTAEGYRLISFRPGSTRLFILEMPEGTHEEWTSPSPIFDVILLPSGGGAAALVATVEGLLCVKGAGDSVTKLEDFSGVAALRATESGVVALEFDGRLSWLDSSLAPSDRLQSSPDGWSLLAPELHGRSVGVLPVGVAASTVGEFLEGGGMQVAAATDGQLVLVDQGSGAELFRAHWPGIEHMAAGDLDGDGLEELILAAGSSLAALTAQSNPSAAATSD